MNARICVSILPKTVAEAKSLIEKSAEAGADFVEVRLDNLKDVSELSNLRVHGNLPLIATHRKAAVAGIDPQRTLLQAAKSGFEYVDVDMYSPNLAENAKKLVNFGAKLILSFHDRIGPIKNTELEKILDAQIKSKASVCKIVTTARTLEDNLPLLEFTSKASRTTKIVCFAMGEQGKISRLISPLFGGFFTFASLERGAETAPGQMTIQEMKTAYTLLGVKK